MDAKTFMGGCEVLKTNTSLDVPCPYAGLELDRDNDVVDYWIVKMEE